MPKRERRYTQGLCKKCDALHIWDESLPKVRNANCPGCGAPLQRTTHLSKAYRVVWPGPLGLGVPSTPKREN